MIQRLIGLRRNDRGVAAAEFAITIPVLVLFLAGIVQLGILFMANAGLRNAVAEGARYATIYPRPSDAEITDRVTDERFGLADEHLEEPVIVHGVSDGANYVEITLSYSIPLNFIFFTLGPVTLSDTRRAFVQPIAT
jgi:hypothetical protein